MAERIKNFVNKAKFGVLYLTIQIKIFLLGSVLAKRNLKNIFIFLSVLVLVSPSVLSAQAPQWPWIPKGENFQITANSGNNFRISVASNGELYLLVWARKTSDGFDIYGVRIDRNGNRLPRIDENGNETAETEIPICTAPNDQLSPAVSWNGNNFLVVWEDQRNGKWWDIFGALVTSEGNVLKEFHIAAGKPNYDQAAPDIAFDGENHLVTWQGKRSPKTWNIYFTVVSRKGGLLLGKPVQLAPSSKDQAYPAAAFDGKNYLIVWQDKKNSKSWNIYGARVAPSGDPVGQGPFQISFTEGYDRWNPMVSWNGKYYLVVWTAFADKNTSSILGKRVSVEGDPLDNTDLGIVDNDLSAASPALVWAGSEYLLVWEDEPSGSSKISGASLEADYHLTVSESGLISSGSRANPSSPAVAVVGNDALVVWQEGPNPDTGWNLFGQIISRPGLPAPAGSNGTGAR